MIMKIGREYIQRIIRYQIFNWLGALVNFSVLWFLHSILKKPLMSSAVAAIEMAIIHNFTWHYFFTWEDRVVHTIPDFVKRLFQFNLVNLSIDLACILSALWIMTTYLNSHYLLADWIGMIAGSFLKLAINEFVVFRPTRTIVKKRHV